MPLEITPDVHVRRDAQGRIRQLSHMQRPYRPDRLDLMAAGLNDQAITPRGLADQYIRDAAGVLDFAPSAVANFAAAAGTSPTDAGVELRFKEEKTVGNGATVAYCQTVLGLPIWDAGVSVRIDSGALHVTGAHNAAHYEVRVQKPATTAQYLPHLMDVNKVRAVLGLSPNDPELKINATRAVVYFFQPANRFDPRIHAHENADESSGLAGDKSVKFPTLPLPPLPESIKPDTHFVVTEVLFSFPFPEWGPLNWRAFVEPETGAVLYLRAFVSCAHGAVFLTDPVTATGLLLSAATPVEILDPLRQSVPLLGLNTPNPTSGNQELRGEFVRLVDLEPPGATMPSENAPFEFSYSCNTANFAACNAYHHCDGVFRLIAGLGIDLASYFNNTDFPVPVDPHAKSNAVNASAPGNVSGNGLGRLVFGVAQSGTTFGITADVRVVLHEFGHAVLWDHVDSPNFGFAHSPGDSWGAILHDPTTNAPDRFETFPFMKASAGLSRRHDRSVASGWAWGGSHDDRQYGSEQILSTTLFRVYRAAGGDSASLPERQFASRYVTFLILKGVGLLSFTTSDPDVYVSALTEADATTVLFEGHPGGAFSKVFRWSFETQGLYQPPGGPLPVTHAGLPPEVDVYIEDGRGGAYMPYNTDFRGSAEIWNRSAPDGGLTHQPPVVGVPSFAYVLVRNRGTTSATAVSIRGFQSRIPGAAIWPNDWKPLSPTQLNLPGPLSPNSAAPVGPFPWTPMFSGEQLLFAASASGDRSNLETVTAGPIVNARLVPLDNNIAQREM